MLWKKLVLFQTGRALPCSVLHWYLNSESRFTSSEPLSVAKIWCFLWRTASWFKAPRRLGSTAPLTPTPLIGKNYCSGNDPVPPPPRQVSKTKCESTREVLFNIILGIVRSAKVIEQARCLFSELAYVYAALRYANEMRVAFSSEKLSARFLCDYLSAHRCFSPYFLVFGRFVAFPSANFLVSLHSKGHSTDKRSAALPRVSIDCWFDKGTFSFELFIWTDASADSSSKMQWENETNLSYLLNKRLAQFVSSWKGCCAETKRQFWNSSLWDLRSGKMLA